jgi:hypothetical protein
MTPQHDGGPTSIDAGQPLTSDAADVADVADTWHTCPPSQPSAGAYCSGNGGNCWYPVEGDVCAYRVWDCYPTGQWGWYSADCGDGGAMDFEGGATDAGLDSE